MESVQTMDNLLNRTHITIVNQRVDFIISNLFEKIIVCQRTGCHQRDSGTGYKIKNLIMLLLAPQPLETNNDQPSQIRNHKYYEQGDQ